MPPFSVYLRHFLPLLLLAASVRAQPTPLNARRRPSRSPPSAIPRSPAQAYAGTRRRRPRRAGRTLRPAPDPRSRPAEKRPRHRPHCARRPRSLESHRAGQPDLRARRPSAPGRRVAVAGRERMHRRRSSPSAAPEILAATAAACVRRPRRPPAPRPRRRARSASATREHLALIDSRARAGAASAIDSARARAAVSSAEAEFAPHRSSRLPPRHVRQLAATWAAGLAAVRPPPSPAPFSCPPPYPTNPILRARLADPSARRSTNRAHRRLAAPPSISHASPVHRRCHRQRRRALPPRRHRRRLRRRPLRSAIPRHQNQGHIRAARGNSRRRRAHGDHRRLRTAPRLQRRLARPRRRPHPRAETPPRSPPRHRGRPRRRPPRLRRRPDPAHRCPRRLNAPSSSTSAAKSSPRKPTTPPPSSASKPSTDSTFPPTPPGRSMNLHGLDRSPLPRAPPARRYVGLHRRRARRALARGPRARHPRCHRRRQLSASKPPPPRPGEFRGNRLRPRPHRRLSRPPRRDQQSYRPAAPSKSRAAPSLHQAGRPWPS